MKAAENYYSKDFEWEQLKQDVENDPSLLYHFTPYTNPATGTQDLDPSPSSSSLPKQDSEAWNKFHTRHSTGKFFKERRYLLKEFPEIASCDEYSIVLEVGCGNGSTALPILRGNEGIFLYGCDCSDEAVQRTKENINAANLASAEQRFYLFQCDFSASRFPQWLICNSCRESSLPERRAWSPDSNCNWKRYFPDPLCLVGNSCCIGGVDFLTLIFTLSALPIHRMPIAIHECLSVLRPGGLLLFRDYGLYDMTMLRFEPEQRVGFREYMRCDGTRSYFFCLESVRDLFCSAGFVEVELEYCCVKSVNRRNGKSMKRVWVHGKFQKP
nr:methyltransferase-like protein 6 [Ipomoea batatas]GME20717.1 methyltransferase-like protein 6 [Ipomoea batatas]